MEHIFNYDDLSRDLAWLYANGRLDCDLYLTLWHDLTAQFAVPQTQ